jgi:hypothetical protein
MDFIMMPIQKGIDDWSQEMTRNSDGYIACPKLLQPELEISQAITPNLNKPEWTAASVCKIFRKFRPGYHDYVSHHIPDRTASL